MIAPDTKYEVPRSVAGLFHCFLSRAKVNNACIPQLVCPGVGLPGLSGFVLTHGTTNVTAHVVGISQINIPRARDIVPFRPQPLTLVTSGQQADAWQTYPYCCCCSHHSPSFFDNLERGEPWSCGAEHPGWTDTSSHWQSTAPASVLTPVRDTTSWPQSWFCECPRT